MPSTRYTAHLQVVRVDEGEQYAIHERGKVPKTEKSEIASITVRAGDLEALRTKLMAHVALIDE